MKQSIVERIKNIIITLLNADVVGDCLTILSIAERLELPLSCVRNDIAELMNISKKMDFVFGVAFEDETLNIEMSKVRKAIKNGSMDNKELFAYFNTINGVAYVNLDYKEYDAVLKFIAPIKDNFLTNQYAGEEIYKLCRDYNTYISTNSIVHAKIVRAIEYGEAIRFLYKRPDSTQTVTIKPIRIIEYATFGRSYAISVQDERLVAFRLDRIKNVEIVDEKKIEVGNDSVQNEILQKINYVWDMDFQGEFDVKFKVYNDNAGRVIEKVKRDIKQYVDCAGYKITEVDGGNIIVEGHVIGKGAFERYIRSYGASIVVFEPQEVVEDIVRSNEAKLEMYS